MWRHKESGLYFPDGESHFTRMSKQGRPVWQDYQKNHLEAALAHVKHFDVAIDGGAHIGLMTRQLAERFAVVYAFEPHPENFACLEQNTAHLPNVVLLQEALGEAVGTMSIETNPNGNSGDQQLIPGADVLVGRLDGYDLPGCDFLKLDLQGYELPALRGAFATLVSFAPAMMIEVEPPKKLRHVYGSDKEISKYLRELGARMLDTQGADQIWAFGPNGAMPYHKYEARGDYHWKKYNDPVPTIRDRVDAVAAYVRSQKHESIIDIGCGDGLFTVLLGAYGIDNNQLAIKLAKEHGADCLHWSAYRIKQLGRTFEAAFLADTFEHLHKQDLMLRLLGEVITKAIYVLNPTPSATAGNLSPYHSREFTTDAMTAYFAKAGWRLVNAQDYYKPGRDIPLKTLLHFERQS